MKKYKVWGYSGNPCKYKIVSKIVIAENIDHAIRKSMSITIILYLRTEVTVISVCGVKEKSLKHSTMRENITMITTKAKRFMRLGIINQLCIWVYSLRRHDYEHHIT